MQRLVEKNFFISLVINQGFSLHHVSNENESLTFPLSFAFEKKKNKRTKVVCFICAMMMMNIIIIMNAGTLKS